MAIFEHSLNYSAAKLIDTVSNYMILNLLDHFFKDFRVNHLPHVDYDPLNNVVSVEVEGAIFDLFLTDYLLYH